jgi:hypothetical protein
VPPSAYPLAFPEAFASEAILPTTRLATYHLLKINLENLERVIPFLIFV